MSDEQFNTILGELQAIHRLLEYSVTARAATITVAAPLPNECVAESLLGLKPTAASSPATAVDLE